MDSGTNTKLSLYFLLAVDTIKPILRKKSYGPYELHDPISHDLCDKGRLNLETLYTICHPLQGIQ
jgi:hypothetical protein